MTIRKRGMIWKKTPWPFQKHILYLEPSGVWNVCSCEVRALSHLPLQLHEELFGTTLAFAQIILKHTTGEKAWGGRNGERNCYELSKIPSTFLCVTLRLGGWRHWKRTTEAELKEEGQVCQTEVFSLHFSSSYSIFNWQKIKVILPKSRFFLWQQWVSDLTVLSLTHRLLHPIFSPCPFEETQGESSWVSVWQPTKHVPPWRQKDYPWCLKSLTN